MFKVAIQRKLFTPSILSAAPRVLIPASASFRQPKYFAMASDSRTTIAEAIVRDHRELEEYYNNIKNASDHDTATRWQNQFVWELARHSIGEELVVYPAFEKYLGEKGMDMANKDRAEHNQLKVELKKFQNLNSTDAEFHPTLDALWKDLHNHIREEETHDLPTLEKALNTDVTVDIAKSFERTKMFTPTRSHPSAPNKPPFETAVGLLAAPFDKLADMFRKFPTH